MTRTDDPAGGSNGRADRLTAAVPLFAAGGDPDLRSSAERGILEIAAGFEAVRILPALADLNMRKGHADPFAPFTPEEAEQRASLDRAYLTGRVPAWLKRHPAR